VVLSLAPAGLASGVEGAEPANLTPPALAALVAGECTLRPGAGAAAAPLRLLDQIPAGGLVETGLNARLVVVFLTGERFELGPGSSAVVAGSALGQTRGTVRALEPVSPRVALAPLAAPRDASPRAGAVRVRGDESLAMYPAGGAAVDPGEAVLRFAAVPAAEKYAVAVEDEAGNTVFSAQTGATRVALPREVLREGAVYFWRVRPRGPGLSGTAREERFATLSPDEARRWAVARADLSAADPGLQNLLAATASSLGLRREACLAARSAGGAAAEGAGAPFDCEDLAPFLSPE
jgi:hypothetical protein